jgi:hypothetical protein
VTTAKRPSFRERDGVDSAGDLRAGSTAAHWHDGQISHRTLMMSTDQQMLRAIVVARSSKHERTGWCFWQSHDLMKDQQKHRL